MTDRLFTEGSLVAVRGGNRVYELHSISVGGTAVIVPLGTGFVASLRPYPHVALSDLVMVERRVCA